MIGGLYCESPNAPLAPRARSWFMVCSRWYFYFSIIILVQMMTSLWRKIWDLTYAYSAMFTGAGFNTTLQTLFGDKEIDDLWIPYFCITTNISTSEMRVRCKF
jgi:lysophospholipid hydrolase